MNDQRNPLILILIQLAKKKIDIPSAVQEIENWAADYSCGCMGESNL